MFPVSLWESKNLFGNLQNRHSGVGRNPDETSQNLPLDSRFHGNDEVMQQVAIAKNGTKLSGEHLNFRQKRTFTALKRGIDFSEMVAIMPLSVPTVGRIPGCLCVGNFGMVICARSLTILLFIPSFTSNLGVNLCLNFLIMLR